MGLKPSEAAPVAITMGDPAGIGPEIILKAAARIIGRPGAPRMVVLGDLTVMRETAARLGCPEPLRWQPGAEATRKFVVKNLSELPAKARKPGRPTVEGAEAAYRYVLEGAHEALAGDAAALVTAPLSKEWLNRAGHRFSGHSEMLARISGTRLWRMMFVGDELKVALVTAHIALRSVPRALTPENVYQTIALMARHLAGSARIAVLGLNPHAGEGGMFGGEEALVIAPAIARARRAGIDAYGPVPPDTAFARPAGRPFAFDAAVAMYHDQGLGPLKTLEIDRAVNVTIGLPFVRTSPDHGTAYDIAGKGQASAESMIAAIEYAWRAGCARRIISHDGRVDSYQGRARA